MEKKKKEKKVQKQTDFKQKLEGCEKLRDEYLAGWQRAQADFSNYKKEEAERAKEILDYVQREFILKILPILDNFYLAESKVSEDLKNNADVDGLLKIKNQFQEFLKTQGIEEIETSEKEFDPNFHEAVEQAEAKDKDSDIIIEEIEKGYILKGKVIRPAKVKVAK
ncbi:nucleotide exchange factor GrpE [Candidatus Parcubacteria bacterium]|nr:nucleotide exchange factor GrpE [Candidatus Parcubacteria bacterium]